MKRLFSFLYILIFSLSLLCVSSCRKNSRKIAEESTIEEKVPDSSTEVEKDFKADEAPEVSEYSDMSIEELAAYESEEERIASVMEELENHVNDSEATYDEDEFAKPSLDFCNSDGLLSFSQFDNEVIELSKDNEKRVTIYSIGNKVNRRFFDSDYRLEKTEYWEIDSLDTSKIIKNEFLYYKGEEKRPYLKTVDYEDKLEDFYYNADGTVEKSENYKKVNGKKYITEICQWTFDSQKRITRIKTRTFIYNSEEDTKRRDVFVKIFSYKYNPPSEDGEEIPPDVQYFENDVLKSYERYSPKSGTYTKHYYFDGGISIKSWYVDDKKVREAVYHDGKVMRVNKIDEQKNPVEN